MGDLVWFEAFPPKGKSLADITAVLRPLATRPPQGIWRSTPKVVFECWLKAGQVQWLLGIDRRLVRSLPGVLEAQAPGLKLVERPRLKRPALRTGATVRSPVATQPLRTDTANAVSATLLHLADDLSRGEAICVQWLIGPTVSRAAMPTPFRTLETLGLRAPATPDTTARQAWKAKSAEPLFLVQGRIGVRATYPRRMNSLISSTIGALKLMNTAQARLVRGRVSTRTARKLIEVTGRGRPAASVLNAAELAGLLGWPLGDSGTLPGQVGPQLSPAPDTLLAPGDAPAFGVRTLGQSKHPADHGQVVTVPSETSLHHLHVIGPTGSGKSTLLAQLALADADAGHSVLVIEPKGDLVRDVLARLPEHRQDDVVLIEPGERGPVVGLNPLRGPRTDAERRADELLSLFKRLFGSSIGPRSSDVLLHALITAARLPGGTLTDVPVLLTSPAFRRKALVQVTDELVLGPYWSRFDAMSEAERAQVIAPILNKLRAFVSRPAVRRMLGQSEPAFTLDGLFIKKRIVLVNLNRGLVGPETAKLIGSLLLGQLWQAIERRGSTPRSRRRPVMVIVDEWQDYAGSLNFDDVLAQARGLGVGFTLAHQHLDQLRPSLRSAVLANARNRVAFRPATGDGKPLAGVMGPSVTPEDLERLGAFQAAARLYVDGTPTPPFTIRTLDLGKKAHSVAMMRATATSRYGVDGDAIDTALLSRWNGGDVQSADAVGVLERAA